MAWHRFAPSSADDQECTHARCGMIAADEAVEFITVDCPAPPCTDPSNAQGSCVIVATEEGAECAYCGHVAAGQGRDDDDEPLTV